MKPIVIARYHMNPLALHRICAFLSAALLMVAVARADEVRSEHLVLKDPWVRASIGRVPNSAAYVVIENEGESDRLTGVESPVAERAELHTHLMDGETMRMRPLEAIDIPSGGNAALAPGGDHIMLFGLKQQLEAGTTIPLVLMFERAGAVRVQAKVLPPGAHHNMD